MSKATHHRGTTSAATAPRLRVFAIACAFLSFLFAVDAALAEKRVALVIGNAQYKNASLVLTNPKNDADDVAAVLRDLGFEVIHAVDATKRDFDLALAQFARLATSADAALFFYAGHALQFQGRNYLMPTDAELEDDVSLRFQMESIEDVRAALDRATGVKIMILDACRNNPMADRLQRKLLGESRALNQTRGLARIDRAQGVVVAYATAADQVAMDGSGRNSPYTTALLKRLREPGLEIEMMFRRIAADVNAQTNGQQRPETYVSLISEYYLNQKDRAIWEGIKSVRNPDTLRDFVELYPTSVYAAEARTRISALEQAARQQQAVRENAEREAARQQQAALERQRQEREATQKRADDEQRVKAEAERRAQEQEQERQRLAALERDRQEREAAQKRAEEEQRLRAEAARKLQEQEQERQRVAALERERQEREAAQLREAAEQRAKADSERTAREQEQERQRLAALERQRQERASAQKRAEDEQRAKAEAARKAQEEERVRVAAIERERKEREAAQREAAQRQEAQRRETEEHSAGLTVLPGRGDHGDGHRAVGAPLAGPDRQSDLGTTPVAHAPGMLDEAVGAVLAGVAGLTNVVGHRLDEGDPVDVPEQRTELAVVPISTPRGASRARPAGRRSRRPRSCRRSPRRSRRGAPGRGPRPPRTPGLGSPSGPRPPCAGRSPAAGSVPRRPRSPAHRRPRRGRTSPPPGSGRGAAPPRGSRRPAIRRSRSGGT